jgi:hypothetical protein
MINRNGTAKPEVAYQREPPSTRPVATDALPPVPVWILHGREVVGSSLLEYPLEAQGAIAGRLVPGPGLHHVSPVFALYPIARGGSRQALDRFVRERDALELEIVDRDGTPIHGHVDLISDWGEGQWMVHLSLE